MSCMFFHTERKVANTEIGRLRIRCHVKVFAMLVWAYGSVEASSCVTAVLKSRTMEQRNVTNSCLTHSSIPSYARTEISA